MYVVHVHQVQEILHLQPKPIHLYNWQNELYTCNKATNEIHLHFCQEETEEMGASANCEGVFHGAEGGHEGGMDPAPGDPEGEGNLDDIIMYYKSRCLEY